VWVFILICYNEFSMNNWLKTIIFLIITGSLLFYAFPLEPSGFDWEKMLASVEIRTIPTDAQIKLGEQQAQGKLTLEGLQPGTYQLKVSKEGFQTHQQEIKIEESAEVKRLVELEFVEQKELVAQKTEVRPPEESVRESALKHLYSVDGIPSPKASVFGPQSEEIWVTSLLNKNKGVDVLNATSGKLIKSINLNNGGGVEITFSDENAYISQMETADVFEVGLNNKNIKRVFNTGSTWTKVLKLSGNKLYASNWVGDDVSIIDLESEKVSRINTVDTPRGLALHNNYLYVAGFEEGQIQKINLDTYQKEIILQTGGAIRHLVKDKKKGVLYASDMARNTIWKVDLETEKVERFAETENNPNTITLSPDKNILAVSCRGKNYSTTNYHVPGPEWGTVMLFDTNNGNLLEVIIGGNQPTGLDISPDGERLVFSNFLDGNIEVYELPAYEKLKNNKIDSYKELLKK